MSEERPPTLRQLARLQTLGIDYDRDISFDEARDLIREHQVNVVNVDDFVLPETALAVGSEGDPAGGRQFEK